MIFLIFEATPAPENTEDAGSASAVIDCWINTDDEQEAEELAREQIAAEGWQVQQMVTLRSITEEEITSNEGRESFEMALEYGGTFTFYTSDADDQQRM